jgi:hypothetical protein
MFAYSDVSIRPTIVENGWKIPAAMINSIIITRLIQYYSTITNVSIAVNKYTHILLFFLKIISVKLSFQTCNFPFLKTHKNNNIIIFSIFYINDLLNLTFTLVLLLPSKRRVTSLCVQTYRRLHGCSGRVRVQRYPDIRSIRKLCVRGRHDWVSNRVSEWVSERVIIKFNFPAGIFHSFLTIKHFPDYI